MNTSAEPATGDLVSLAGDWALWPEFALRSAGFPASGLDRFGPGDETGRLAEAASDPRFREAVAWQSRDSLRREVVKLANGGAGSPSRQRRRLDVTGAYWQRYCAKNDTIGYFGPLAWGHIQPEGPAIAVRGGAADQVRTVHFETWAVEAVGAAAGVTSPLPMGPWPERALRPLLVDTSPLDRMEAARERVAAARGDDVATALDALDAVFEQVAGRPAVKQPGDSGGGRTIAYLDCMRDLDLTIGGEVSEELRDTLPAILSASRWWNGRVFGRGAALLAAMSDGHDGPLAPLVGRLMGAGFGLWDQMGEEKAELQRRWAQVAGGGDPGTVFGDWTPAWPGSVYQSADLQLAAASPEAADAGDFLLVLGDFHGGDNPLAQGLFGLRHPDPTTFAARLAREAGPSVQLSPPRHGPVDMTARAWPIFTPGSTVVMAGDEPAPDGMRRAALEDLVLEQGIVRDRTGTFSVPLAELLYLPIFVSAIRSFAPVAAADGQRVQLGRLVVRRATWTAAAGELPENPDDLGFWARERGIPRRCFVRSPLERKPRYVDLESPSLLRGWARFVAPAREQAPSAPVEVVEMLPAPEDCWLPGDDGPCTSELRVIAVDRTQLAVPG
ncbi:MAG: lantibiotic dehydratase [Solirubrobacteraceae bacterium]|nr:lantibiotic dehydratase [Solirubrobacteraceae bacterium]